MKENPALSAFVAAIGTELVFGQVSIRRGGEGFDLRHEADRHCGPASLRTAGIDEIRLLAQFTEAGLFRPLKSAPNLRRGWRCVARDAEELGLTLNQLYPGAVADWFAAGTQSPPITSYRDFTERQTGMYRITTFLDDATAAAAIRACCHKDFCLKRRLWTVNGLAPDTPTGKSLIPCLAPCAVLLEFARRIARLQQAGELEGAGPPPAPDFALAECNFEAPNNPRRVQFGLEWRAIRQKLVVG